jgi:hypothetical protein
MPQLLRRKKEFCCLHSTTTVSHEKNTTLDRTSIHEKNTNVSHVQPLRDNNSLGKKIIYIRS